MKTTRIITALFAIALAPLSAQALVNIDFVAVGNPGNAADPLNSGSVPGIGSVADAFAIGKYEVTLNQYTEFLNAKAATDTFSLYPTSMATDLNIAGISRAGSSGSLSYSVIGDGQRPVTYVSFFDAVRFTNWLQNGQGSGSTETGAYTLLGGTATPTNWNTVTRNTGVQFWLPSENEWYKAAYHQPVAAGGDSDNYWFYPTRSNTVPGNNISSSPNQANFYDGSDYSVTQSGNYSSSQNYLTPGGAYSGSASFYGTFDQGGNVFEWDDTMFVSSSRGLRGGSWSFSEFDLRSSPRNYNGPAVEYGFVGFRVATVPEPTVFGMLTLGTLLLLSRRKRLF